MKAIKTLIKSLGVALSLALAVLFYLYHTINDYQVDGQLTLDVLDASATVYRDSQGIPYIEAESLADALRVQGFVVGQERLYQAQLFRVLALGRLSEVFGERGINNDTLIRLVNLKQVANDYLDSLDDAGKAYYKNYIEGLNAYILNYSHEHPIELKLIGMPVEPWTLHDIITLQLFQAWSTSSLWRNELLTQDLINEVGSEKAQLISQVSVNPKDGSRAYADLGASSAALETPRRNLIHYEQYESIPDGISAGSNAWATGSRKSSNGLPIFANSPHLPATTLPGFWLPMGLFTNDIKAAGVSAPGSPGIGVGRNQYIAYGATVGGGDGVDLFVEQLDPLNENHYIENNESHPLRIRTDTFKIKDKSQASGFRIQTLQIRATSRGPIISDHGITSFGDNEPDKALSLAWAMLGSQTDSLGSSRLLVARNIEEAQAAISHFPGSLSHVVADTQGGIARISSGRIPIRTQGDGSHPLDVNTFIEQPWAGRIAQSDMPKDIRPEEDWVATANQRIVPQDYPYEFSKDFAAAWRYRRLKQVLESTPRLSVEDHWSLINDVYNPMAERLVPLFAAALSQHDTHSNLAQVLTDWDRKDTVDQIAPTLFQLIHNHLAKQTFSDELNPEIRVRFFDSVRFWQERLMLMLEQPDHPWFDDITTEEQEKLDDILKRAVNGAINELRNTFGEKTSEWQWGKLHQIQFNSPIIPGDSFAKLFGGGTHPMFGSGQTLNRGKYKLSKAYNATEIDSVRIVVDLSDDEKLRSIIPGGASGRYFQENLTTQLDDWLAGNYQPIWFNLDKIKKEAKTILELKP